MMKKIFTILVFSFFAQVINGQIGADDAFEFLNVAPSARATSLGGMYISVFDDDPNSGVQNPALYNKMMHRQMSFGNVSYLAKTNFGNLAYVHHFDSLFTLGLDVQFANYGKFIQTDPTAAILGEFSGSDLLFNLGLARQQDKISYGINLKAINSSIESFNAFALAMDFGAVYYNPEKEFTFSLVFKNIGGQLTTYSGEEKEGTPFDIQLGISKKLKYLPLRVSIQAHNLNNWDIRYDDPNLQETGTLFGADTIQQNYIADKVFRHLVFGGEFYFGKRVRVRVGYNHLRRQEAKLEDVGGLLGYTFGIGINANRFKIDYGRANFNFTGIGANHLTLTLDLAKFSLPKFKKKKKDE